MLIKTIVENTSLSKDLGSEHGLSLYIETQKHKLLFDVGASQLFLQNAKKIGINIPDMDFLVISHGHYDHGGGLKVFLQENTTADIFLQEKAFEKHYSRESNDTLEDIGLEEELKETEQMVFTSDRFVISEGIQVFSNIVQKEPLPKSNYGLVKEHNGETAEDTFAHEQNLIIEEDGKTLLVTGCAHNGIINILEHFYTLMGEMPDYVIGGFHLAGPFGGSEDPDTIDRIGKYLLGTKAMVYTCHCTGIEPYKRLKAIMGDRIDYLSAGSELIVESL